MKKLLPALLLLIAFASCKKEKSPASSSTTKDSSAITGTTTGQQLPVTVKGTISPADAVTTIVIYDVSSTQHVLKPDANGAFSITGLPAGTYFINYYQSLGYIFQPSKTLNLTAGQSLDLGTVVFSPGFGIIEGTTAPLGAATKVTATNKTTKNTYTAVPDATTGKFKFDNLPGGIYTISYTASPSSTAPPDTSETLPATQHLVLPLAVFKTPGVTGTISGKVDPGNSANVFIAKADNSYGVIIYPDTVSGKFVSPALLPGSYTVSFGHDWTHKSPPSQSVTLPQGQNIDMGTIKIPLYLYLIPFTANGAKIVVGGEVTNCFYNPPKLTITGVNGGGVPEQPSRETSLSISLDDVTGPGTYTLQGTSTSNMTYATGLVTSQQKWGMANGGTATVIITSIDMVQKVIIGTFSATLKPVANATGNMVITNGVLKLTYF